jgi:hypothetical protein
MVFFSTYRATEFVYLATVSESAEIAPRAFVDVVAFVLQYSNNSNRFRLGRRLFR